MNKLTLNSVKWKEFYFTEIFDDIQRGKRLTKKNQLNGNIPYVSSTAANNGVDNFIGNTEGVRIFENCITLANSGSVGSAFFHNYKLVASDHITKLQKINLNSYAYKFMLPIISRLSEKYSFNREINDIRIKREKFILPVDASDNPNWQFMEKYMRQKEQELLKPILKKLEKSILFSQIDVKPLNECKWKEFFLEDIAEILSGRDIYEKERIIGNTPYITSTANNNGIGYFVDNSNNTLEKNCLSVNRNGSVGYAFYHSYSALYSNDTRKLRPKFNNSYSSIFIAAMITKQKDKYGYGYKMGTARLKRQKIMLPINVHGEPDFEYMSNYTKKVKLEKIKIYLSKRNICSNQI